MNKKVSTLLTVALTLGGSLLSSSAFAESVKDLVGTTTPITSFSQDNNNGADFVMTQTFNGAEYAYGFEKGADGKIKQIVEKFDVEKGFTKDDLSKFAWTITETKTVVSADQTIYRYTFKNVSTGEYLEVVKDASGAVVTDVDTSVDGNEVFLFDGHNPYNGSQVSFISEATIANNTYYYAQMYDGSSLTPAKADEMKFANGTDATTVTGASALKFYRIQSSQVEGEALNKLFNSKGFSFAINTGVAGKTVEENLFQNVRAIDLKETINAKEDGQKWGFPVGTYFVTKASYEATKKAKGYDYDQIGSRGENPNDVDKLKWEYLRSLTFIAVSSTETIEATGVDRKNGQGFELVQVAGNDLYDYIGTDLDKLPRNKHLSVFNACFHVEGLSTKSYPYSIKLKKFYYVSDADALAAANGKGENYAQTEKEVNLMVLDHGTPAAYYLTTSKEDTNAAPFIFKFDESNIEKGISFLKADGPAVYNIRFVSGKTDLTERGKYLTVGFGNADQTMKFLAKGEALADAEALATPAYQFVITNVEGNDVTFTNRESGENFTAKLYKEREENGKTIYSLSSEKNDAIFIVNINSNSYGTTIATTPVNLNNVEIELLESSVDAKSGYLNVANGTLMTIKYARDAHSTSNLWYAAVGKGDDSDDNVDLIKAHATNEAFLSNDLYSAAQWQLVKVGEVDLDRDYAYNNQNSISIKGYGDKLKANLYTFNYVTDGTATDLFLCGEAGSLDLTNVKNNISRYIVRENPNGSVSLIKYDDRVAPFNNSDNAFANDAVESILKLNNDKFIHTSAYIYDAERADNELLTFLVNESPEISWKAEEGHVTIQSAGGDFLTMAENKEAIIVDEANADKLYLHVDKKGNGIIPSFYISKGYVKGSNSASERMFLYNPIDSVEYQVDKPHDPRYQLSKDATKAVFKSGILNETRDTLSLTVKGEVAKKVAAKSNNQQNVWAGLNRFQFQIVETEEGDATYYIRQPKANKAGNATWYLANANDKAVWVAKDNTTLPPYTFVVEDTTAPTSNETVAASEVKVVAQDGAVVVKNAAGKNVVVSTILGQVVANEVLTSDNATINVPAGIVVVAVDGESFKVNVK